MKKRLDVSQLYRILYIVVDIAVINASSILAMLLRFNLSFADIEPQYFESVTGVMFVNTVVTLLLFAICRL